MTFLRFTAAALIASAAFAGAAHARDQIKIVGSSTVFPYMQAAAEEYANKSGKPAPVVESTGTGGGFKVFCGGIGPDFPDISNASRAIKDSEIKLCADNGVVDITEAKIGFDGLTIAMDQAAADMDLTKEQLYKALAAELPDGKGGFVANASKTWSDIDPKLPNTPITVFGPPPTSGTRDAFVELVMDAGCSKQPGMADLKKADEKKYKEVCSRMRQDGPFIEAGENDNLIVQRLEADKNAVGIFGYSFLYENSDKLKGAKIEGVEVTEESIADGTYPIARPLFFYVKNAHRDVIPGLKEFLTEATSEEALGDDGYMVERGLTPLSAELREATRKAVADAVKLAK